MDNEQLWQRPASLPARFCVIVSTYGGGMKGKEFDFPSFLPSCRRRGENFKGRVRRPVWCGFFLAKGRRGLECFICDTQPDILSGEPDWLKLVNSSASKTTSSTCQKQIRCQEQASITLKESNPFP